MQAPPCAGANRTSEFISFIDTTLKRITVQKELKARAIPLCILFTQRFLTTTQFFISNHKHTLKVTIAPLIKQQAPSYNIQRFKLETIPCIHSRTQQMQKQAIYRSKDKMICLSSFSHNNAHKQSILPFSTTLFPSHFSSTIPFLLPSCILLSACPSFSSSSPASYFTSWPISRSPFISSPLTLFHILGTLLPLFVRLLLPRNLLLRPFSPIILYLSCPLP